jgi:hypothetical protein
MTKHDNDLRTLDILTHEAGLHAMDESESTADDRRWAEELAASMQTRIAEYRRSRLAQHVPIKKAPPISERLLAMPRAALEALFGSLVDQLGPDAQFAHRKLETLSDNDLRRLIQTIETHAQKD